MTIPGLHEAQERYDHALPPEDDTCEECGNELDSDNPDLTRCTACLAARAESRRETREER